MSAFADNAYVTAGNTGTADFNDGTALAGFRTLAAACLSGKTYSYKAMSLDRSQWEIGIGVFTSGSPGTLARTTILASNTGSKVDFTLAPLLTITGFAADYREKLNANRTYYVRTDGNDNNSGLANTSGGAFLTVQAAVDAVYMLDLNGFDVTISVASGTWTAAVTAFGLFTGKGTVTINGNGGTWNVTAGRCLEARGGAKITVSNYTMRTTTSGECLVAQDSGTVITIGSSMTFGASAGIHLWAYNGGLIQGRSNYTISGNAIYHWVAQQDAIVDVQGVTITLSGTPAFSGAFAWAVANGTVVCGYNTFSGSGTGTRFISSNGLIDTNASGLTYLPGNAIGVVTGSGHYDIWGAKGTTVRKRTTTTKTSDTSYASDPDLQIALDSGVIYQIKVLVFFTAPATPGFKYRVNGPAITFANVERRHRAPNTTTLVIAGETTLSNNVNVTGHATSNGMVEYLITIQPSASGTFAFQWAQQTSDAGGVSVLAGSTIEVNPVSLAA